MRVIIPLSSGPGHIVSALAVYLAILLSVSVLGSAIQDWDRPGAARAYDQASKLSSDLHAKSPALRTIQEYLAVIQKYQEVLLKDPHYGACDDALYFIAKLYQEAGARFEQPHYYQVAVDTYARLVQQYPATAFGPDALMAAANILLNQLTKQDLALAQYQKIISMYPGKSEAKEAKLALEKLQAQKSTVTVTSATASIPKILEPPQASKLTSQGVRTLTRTLGLKAGIVVIDPGHGGHDTGTTSKSGLQEKDLALDLALRLKSLLKERMGVEAVLTRSKDTFVSLEERTHIANKHKADLFISLHANHSSSSRVSGVETYVLNFARSVYERELAARENAAAHYRIADLEDLIRAIAHEEKLAESVEFARFVQKSLQAEMTRQNPSSRSRGVKQAPFVVLAGSAMPSILTEVAFLSNPRDSAALSKEKARAATAEALYKGIFGYVQSLSQEASLRRQPSR